MEKLLSVIVSAYNFEKYLEECIDSIYNQKITYGYEVIVRDDCSKDNTKDVLVKLKEKVCNWIYDTWLEILRY